MKSYLTLVFLFTLIFSFAQEKSDEIQWATLEEASEILEKDSSKKVYILFYTDWCGWCRKMNKSTMQDSKLAEFMNENYIVVKFNAESKDDVEFLGRNYRYIESPGARRGVNSFAFFKLKGELSYPSSIVLNGDGKTDKVIRGYRTADQLRQEL